MSRPHFWLGSWVLVAIFLPRIASASDIFATTIQTNLALGSRPPCVTCHDTEVGGANTANQPVGRKVRAYGLIGGDTETLAAILGKMRDAKDDSDIDGVSDIDEIKAGTNPNINDFTGEPPEDYPPPVYGCHAGPASADHPRQGNWAAVAAVALGFFWLRSRAGQGRAMRVPRQKDV
jgi:MYXO-CTERM domain-containing protein